MSATSRAVRAAFGVIAAGGSLLAGGASCDPIEPRPIVDPPLNTCPCDAYEPGATTAARCTSRNRCEILTAGGRPEYPFWIVVHVPDSSIYAPGSTFVLSSETAFKEPEVEPGEIPRCRPSLGCLMLGGLVGVSGSYRVTNEVSTYVGYPLADGTSIPVRVVYESLGETRDGPRLPLDRLFGTSRLVKGGEVEFARAVPAGNYRRAFYPQPPFDALFPPRVDEQEVTADFFVDGMILGVDKKLDDMNGMTRTARITREVGLDGFRTWIVEKTSQRRISVVRTLSGAEAEVELYTSIDKGLGDIEAEAVVAPPEGWTGVPRYVTELFQGSGLQSLNYPPIPPPVAVTGVVAEPTASPTDPLFGYAAHITFESTGLLTDRVITSEPELSPLLRYSATVNTDDRGRFATVLPPGKYTATIEPAGGTGYATKKESVVVTRTATALTFQPPRLTLVRGRAVLTDGRPLGEADVIAVPNQARSLAGVPTSPESLLTPVPRPSRTRTAADGTFVFELDPGPYALSVIPTAGTGFPRVVARPEIPSTATDLPDIRVPAPTRLAFELRHPSPLTGNVIKHAVVRIFARPAVPGGTPVRADLAVEIGAGMTDAQGKVEILLAQEPR